MNLPTLDRAGKQRPSWLPGDDSDQRQPGPFQTGGGGVGVEYLGPPNTGAQPVSAGGPYAMIPPGGGPAQVQPTPFQAPRSGTSPYIPPFQQSDYTSGTVDYNSRAWQMASQYAPPPDLIPVWQALPDHWKAEMGTWDPQARSAYLWYVAQGDKGVMYQTENGMEQMIAGTEAARMFVLEMRKKMQGTTTPGPGEVQPTPTPQRPSVNVRGGY